MKNLDEETPQTLRDALGIYIKQLLCVVVYTSAFVLLFKMIKIEICAELCSCSHP